MGMVYTSVDEDGVHRYWWAQVLMGMVYTSVDGDGVHKC